MTPNQPKIWITEASHILGRSTATVRRLDDQLRPTRGPGGERVYDRRRVEALAERWAKNPPRPGRPRKART